MSVALEGVSFAYGNDAKVVDNVSFRVGPGEAIALVGPSGSGKSTLLAIIGLLLLPDTGFVKFGDVVVEQRGRRRKSLRVSEVAWVLQGLNILGRRTVLDNATLGLLAHGFTRRSARESAMKQLSALGLEDLVDRTVDTLSGGQLQRVCIARALAMTPRVLLADEPTGQLDGSTSELVIESLLGAARAAHTSLVVATHDREVVASCDRVIEMVR